MDYTISTRNLYVNIIYVMYVEDMSSNRMDEARTKMYNNFNEALNLYTMIFTINSRQFWIDTGLLFGHKNQSKQIMETIGHGTVNNLDVGEFYKTACVFNVVISPKSTSCDIEECVKALKCFTKFLTCVDTFDGPDAFFHEAYTKHPNFKKKWVEALRCIVTFTQYNWQEIEKIVEEQESVVNMTRKDHPQYFSSKQLNDDKSGLQHMRTLLEL